VTDNEKRQDLLQDRLERTEARLRAQYQRLDSQMSDLNARMVRMKSSLGLG
jgi:flagellar capping protein FliD